LCTAAAAIGKSHVSLYNTRALHLFLPEYEKAAKELKDAGSKIKLAKVDATVEKKLGDDHNVKGFPTLKFFKNGEIKEYNGPREAKV